MAVGDTLDALLSPSERAAIIAVTGAPTPTPTPTPAPRARPQLESAAELRWVMAMRPGVLGTLADCIVDAVEDEVGD